MSRIFVWMFCAKGWECVTSSFCGVATPSAASSHSSLQRKQVFLYWWWYLEVKLFVRFNFDFSELFLESDIKTSLTSFLIDRYYDNLVCDVSKFLFINFPLKSVVSLFIPFLENKSLRLISKLIFHYSFPLCVVNKLMV